MNVILLIICLGAFAVYLDRQRAWGGIQLHLQSTVPKPLRFPWPIRVILVVISSVFVGIILSFLMSIFLAAFTRHLGSNFAFTLEHFRILPQRGWWMWLVG